MHDPVRALLLLSVCGCSERSWTGSLHLRTSEKTDNERESGVAATSGGVRHGPGLDRRRHWLGQRARRWNPCQELTLTLQCVMLERSSLGPSSSGAGGSPFLAVGLRYHLAASRVIDLTLIKANGAMWISQARVLPGKEESTKGAYAEGAGTRRTCSALQPVSLLTEFFYRPAA
jgi:hypothetical protein